MKKSRTNLTSALGRRENLPCACCMGAAKQGMKWTIRQEKDSDAPAIASVTQAAFAGKPYADGNEAELPARLRDAGALVLSLVAVSGKDVIGHVALSPAKVGGAGWLALGPVAVRPDVQSQGIASGLIQTALSVARAYGRGGVVLTGDPAFYSRFGFEVSPELTLNGEANKYLQALSFGAEATGDVRFHPVFSE